MIESIESTDSDFEFLQSFAKALYLKPRNDDDGPSDKHWETDVIPETGSENDEDEMSERNSGEFEVTVHVKHWAARD
jgi:hypothetical protein